ncbi:MAG: dihydrodipicolinate synthase family protein [Phycisphaeraceae bacterium]|nr:dihydrodipicolinate synthase family protein [Phycisphaeraceae bacterium]
MANSKMDPAIKAVLDRGVAIPAQPLALNVNRKLDERRQLALSRYYIASGVGGLAVGVHTTQFEIRNPEIGLFKPVLQLAAQEMDTADHQRDVPLLRLAGIVGKTKQAVSEASLLAELGYHAGLLSLAAMKDVNEDQLITHCQQVASVIPMVGFYLQAAVGGGHLSYSFWRRFAEIENVVAIKMAPFNRYQTVDVIRAVAESGREDIALYTGNDDNIVMDLLTPHCFTVEGKKVTRRVVGGLLGHWSVWTQKAVTLLAECQQIAASGEAVPVEMIQRSIQVTDSNAAFFDAANHYQGVIAGLHQVLHRQGLLEGIWCLDPNETLGPGQAAQIDRVDEAYPHLNDDAFVAEHLDQWLAG